MKGFGCRPVVDLYRRGILDFPLLNGGEFAIVYCFMFLYLGIAGGGQWSLGRFVRPHLDPPYRRSWPEQQLSRAQTSEATFIPILPSLPHELPAYLGCVTRNFCGIKTDFASHRLHA